MGAHGDKLSMVRSNIRISTKNMRSNTTNNNNSLHAPMSRASVKIKEKLSFLIVKYVH